MSIKNSETIPAVNVKHHEKANQDKIRLILEGIEEESVPYTLKERNDSALNLAAEACQISKLGVGIGIDEEQIILHYIKLEDKTPLFTIGTNAKDETIKSLGSNAARLVKGMPFKKIWI